MATRVEIGNTLRRWIEQEGIIPAELNARIGMPRDSTAIYTWLKGKGAPGEEARAKLAEITGIALDHLTPDSAPAEPAKEAAVTPPPRVQRPRSAPKKRARRATAKKRAALRSAQLAQLHPSAPATSLSKADLLREIGYLERIASRLTLQLEACREAVAAVKRLVALADPR